MAVVLAVLVGSSETSLAATSCSYNETTDTVTLTLGAHGDSAILSVAADGAIQYNGVTCVSSTPTDATTANTDTIEVAGAAGTQSLTIDATNAFGPGTTTESTGTSEIEITVDLGADADNLTVTGGPSGDNIFLGLAAGVPNINLNNDDDSNDIAVVGNAATLSYTVNGSDGADTIAADGRAGTGGVAINPMTVAVAVNGGIGADDLAGGDGDDTLNGGADADTLTGGDGGDTLAGGTGDDSYVFADSGGAQTDTIDENGSEGTDTLDFSAVTNAVTVDLSAATALGAHTNRTLVVASGEAANLENVTGGTAGDTLTGNAAANVLTGGAGADTIAGGDGDDTLNGGTGDDTFDEDAAANGADVVVGGDGSDTVDYSARPADSVSVSRDGVANDGSTGEGDNVAADVETVLLNSSPPPPPPSDDSATEQTVPPGGTVTTDPDGTGPTADEPIVVAVTVPSGGTVTIVEQAASGSISGFTLIGVQLDITAPAQSADAPLQLSIQVAASEVGDGFAGVFRNGVLVLPCDDASGLASPDPCVASRTVADGVVTLEVLSSAASTWSVGAMELGSIEFVCPPESTPGAAFDDVAVGYAHGAAIDCVAANDITSGTGTGTYSPSVDVSRAQMATFLSNLLDAAGVVLPAGSSEFTDIDGNPHADSIARLAAAGIVAGRTTTTYDPADKVSREQMATFLVNAFEYATGRTVAESETQFSDVTGTHASNVHKLVGLGVTVGVTATQYDPKNVADRGQMASFLARTLNRLAVEGFSKN